jgi:superfamily II DNA or RNA helicase/HKD family nuclease
MSLIDNQNIYLKDELVDSLKDAESIDIVTGFFYFSGFKLLSDELIDKKVRILIGLEIDHKLIPQIVQASKQEVDDLSRWQPRSPSTSRTELRENYIKTFNAFMNDSDIFDDDENYKIFEIFIEKIKNGTLEIRKTLKDNHQKIYILNNQNSGTIFMGSGNLTYNGLKGQHEISEKFTSSEKLTEYNNHFEEQWENSNSILIASKENFSNFFDQIKDEIWPFVELTPFQLYFRVLHELFQITEEEKVLTPSSITSGKYSDLEYQIDAVKLGLEKLDKYDGLIIADVVGLGKSIIASAISRNLDLNTVIITPPHLIPQWEDYKEEFGIRGSKVFSSGKISEVFDRYKTSSEPILFILDEAHRFRNEETEDYKMLHQITRSHPENKVLLLTATPFNNDPKDLFALIKLFQTPGYSTLASIDNLSTRYRELIERYSKLRRNLSKGISDVEIEEEKKAIAMETRQLIEPIVLRRSRIDLELIDRYKNNLIQNNISFPKVIGPETLEYQLGSISDLYIDTLELLTRSKNTGYIGARYKPTAYFTDNGRKNFLEENKEELNSRDLVIAQKNNANNMKRLLVMRFESSAYAFKKTLQNLIRSNEVIINWWEKEKVVPIMKKGNIPDPSDFEYNSVDGEETEDFVDSVEELKTSGDLLLVKSTDLKNEFILDVKSDLKILEEIYSSWFEINDVNSSDPKVDSLVNKVNEFREIKPDKKIILFSSYKDTVDYLYEQMQEKGIEGIIKYSASESTKKKKEEISRNFDASIPKNLQINDFQILITTDALSEGFNLHRAGIIINVDIPYNPTRVIQRIGRINRINKKVFEEIEIYNYFPSSIGESTIKIKSISTLKMKLFNSVIGSDTKTLTNDEELNTYFKDELDKANTSSNEISWDTKFIQEYDRFKLNSDILLKSLSIPRRSRIMVKNKSDDLTVVFGKKGANSIFTLGNSEGDSTLISHEAGLEYFYSDEDEKGFQIDNEFNKAFLLAKDKLFSKPKISNIKGRRANAIKTLKALINIYPNSTDHCQDTIDIIRELDDISDGSLKDISKLDLKNPQKSYDELLQIVSPNTIKNIREKVKRFEQYEELLLFVKQLAK